MTNMSQTEEIWVIYHIDSLDPADRNAFKLRVFKNKEVYLLDVMHYLAEAEVLPGGTRYTFYSIMGTTKSQLDSPSCVLPVVDRCTHLLLKPSGMPPTAPTGQLEQFADASRTRIYSESTLHHLDQESSVVRGLVRSSTSPARKALSAIIPAGHPFSRGKSKAAAAAKAQAHTHTQAHAQAQAQAQARSQIATNPPAQAQAQPPKASQAPPAKPPRPDSGKGRDMPYSDGNSLHQRRPQHQQQHTHQDQAPRRQQQRHQRNLDSPTGPAITMENAVEGATNAARSLFGFASSIASQVATNVQAQLSGASGSTEQLDNFRVTVMRELAEGSFGTVYLAKDANTDMSFALKQMFCQTREQMDDANREIQALQQFARCPEIIDLVDKCVRTSSTHTNGTKVVMLLFPLYPEGTVWDIIENAGGSEQHLHSGPWPFDEATAAHIISGVARGLDAMHAAGFAHRDVKPHNVLMRKGNPVIMDLGSVTKARVQVRTRSQALDVQEEAANNTSPAYRAPELDQPPSSCDIDERADVWGLGCTMFCVAFGRSPFETPQEGLLRLAILNGNYNVPAAARMHQVTFSDAYLDCIAGMLQVESSNRPFCGEVIQQCRKMLR